MGIPDVRMHDLRHSFASDALMGGVPLAIVGEMLGHRQPNTTKRYAHLANRVVREALEHTAGRIVEASNTSRARRRAALCSRSGSGTPGRAPTIDIRRRGPRPRAPRRWLGPGSCRSRTSASRCSRRCT